MDEEQTAHKSENPWYGPDPGIRPGATTERWQSGRDSAGDEPAAPIDTRDSYGNAGPGLAAPGAGIDVEVTEPEAGPYPLPSVIERPHASTAPGTAPHQPTRDPSMSRAVDRAAAGIDVQAAGYDRANEGPAPGPLEPDAEVEPPASDIHPRGTWGSSG